MPRGLQLRACRGLARVLLRPGGRYRGQVESSMPALPPGFTPVGFARATESYMLFERVMALRGIFIPRWKRKVELAGLEHVEAAVSAGHGAILWVQPCIASTLAVKQALYEAGFPLSHLSRPAHGFSPHPFGKRFVNPVLRRAEVRFLAERVVIDEGQTVGPIRRMRALLKENRVVSITATTAASHIEEFDFHGGTLKLPRGPIELAQSTGAALLPVFTQGSRKEPCVEIFPSVVPPSASRHDLQGVQESVVRWLDREVEEHPLDWIGWRADLFTRSK
ncbi:MAG: hypothetical protein AB7J35_00970 [Dehalococcoidia bacterium]